MLIEFPFWRAVHILEICDNNGNVFNDKPVRPHGDWTLTLASLWQSELASGGKKGVFKDFQLTKDLCLKFSDSSKGSMGNISMKLICIEIILTLLEKWSAFICFLFFLPLSFTYMYMWVFAFCVHVSSVWGNIIILNILLEFCFYSKHFLKYLIKVHEPGHGQKSRCHVA